MNRPRDGAADGMETLAADFAEEVDVLHALVDGLESADLARPTAFKGWTGSDILVHLLFWNRAADLALDAPDQFDAMMTRLDDALGEGRLRSHENGVIAELGRELVALWHREAVDLAARWAGLDPKTRIPWAGPAMSVRTALSARQMEHWAHGQALFDLFDRERPEGARLRNIVVLGVNAYSWSFAVRGEVAPEPAPMVALTGPAGKMWRFGSSEDAGSINGSAVGFAQVVTQTRNIADVDLVVTGEAARRWMERAQCFAGPPSPPPPPGTRGRRTGPAQRVS